MFYIPEDGSTTSRPGLFATGRRQALFFLLYTYYVVLLLFLLGQIGVVFDSHTPFRETALFGAGNGGRRYIVVCTMPVSNVRDGRGWMCCTGRQKG